MLGFATFLVVSTGPPTLPIRKLPEIPEHRMIEAKFAMLNADTKALNPDSSRRWLVENTTSDFFFKTSAGRSFTTSQMVQLLKSEFLILKSVKASTTKITNFSSHPDHLSFTVRTHLDAITKDSHHLVSDSITTNFWKLVKKTYKASSMIVTKQYTTVNGRPQKGI